jgi:hypothetical protein
VELILVLFLAKSSRNKKETWCFKAAAVVYHLPNIRSKDRELQWLISRGKVSPSAIVGSGRFMVSSAGNGFQHHLSLFHAWQFPVTITLENLLFKILPFLRVVGAGSFSYVWLVRRSKKSGICLRDHFNMILMGKPASCKRSIEIDGLANMWFFIRMSHQTILPCVKDHSWWLKPPIR